jgi:hypothetical protein
MIRLKFSVNGKCSMLRFYDKVYGYDYVRRFVIQE